TISHLALLLDNLTIAKFALSWLRHKVELAMGHAPVCPRGIYKSALVAFYEKSDIVRFTA
ncbi:unnamed protein product, partial [marine sediment metagenome]